MTTCPPNPGYDLGYCIGVAPNQVYESCVYLEAQQNDLGQDKATYPYWWLARDLWYSLQSDPMDTPISTAAQPNVAYNLNVRPHIALNCQLPQNATKVTVELVLCQPGLVIPYSTSQNKSFGLFDILVSQFQSQAGESGMVAVQKVPWIPSSNAGDPDGPGHHCLIARCSPSAGVSPDQFDFHLAAEPHAVQHNLNIDVATGFRVEGEGGRRYKFDMGTANLDLANPAPVTVRVVTDPKPRQQVLDILMPQLQQIAGFRNIASLPPKRGFNLQLPDFPDAQVQDKTRLLALFGTGLLGLIWRFIVSLILIILGIFGIRYQPRYEASFQMQPGQNATFTFATDLSDASSGEAFVFHLTHVENNVVKGGNTVVVVAI